MLDEGLDLLTGLLSGERVDHQGTHYRADAVALRPAPVQTPRVPVWVGGSTQAGAVRRRAARADGIVPFKLTDTEGGPTSPRRGTRPGRFPATDTRRR
ncbi:LLM class flavin-dependent oxidoreductase [Micromonospora sp. M12]